MKRVTLCLIAITMLIASCKKDKAPDSDNNSSSSSNTSSSNTGNMIKASFKVNGKVFNLTAGSNDSEFPIFLVMNSPDEGLLIQIEVDAGTVFQFGGPYIANSSQDVTEGRMGYTENNLENHYESSSYDECVNDSFSVHVEKKKTEHDFMVHFTGTFSGHLVSRKQRLDPDDPYSPVCLGPEVKITDGRFSITGLGN